MAAIHSLSQLVALPEFDIFGVPPTQTTVERDILTEHRPIAALSPNTHIQFNLSSGEDEYIQLQESLLYMKIRVSIVKLDKSPITADDWKKVSPVNYLLHSMFKYIELEVGDQLITMAPNSYSYRAYFDALLGFSKESKNSHLTGALWSNDTSDKVIESRSSYIANGTELELMGKLHLDMTFQSRALIGRTRLTLRMYPNKPEFYLMVSDRNISVNVEFLDISLHIHRSKLSPLVVEAHRKAIDSSPAKYPISQTLIKTTTITSGVRDKTIDNLHNGQLPRRVYIAFVSNEAYNGSFLKNPYNFQHFDINYICCYLNGIAYPARPFQPDFKSKKYIREFMALFQESNQMCTDSFVNIDRDSFANGNTIFAFNFSPDLSSGCSGGEGHVSPMKYGALNLEVRFANPLTTTVTVLVYAEFDRVIQILNTGNAVLEYV